MSEHERPADPSTPNATGLKGLLGRVASRAGRWLPLVGGTVWLAGCGRPFRLDGELQEPDPVATRDWLLPLNLDPSGCGPQLRMQLEVARMILQRAFVPAMGWPGVCRNLSSRDSALSMTPIMRIRFQCAQRLQP